MLYRIFCFLIVCFLTEIKCKVCISSLHFFAYIFLHFLLAWLVTVLMYCVVWMFVIGQWESILHPTNAVPSSWGLFFLGGFVLFLLICFNHFIVQIHKFLLLREVNLSALKKNCVFVVYWMLCSSFHITQCLLLSLAGGELGCTSGWQREI